MNNNSTISEGIDPITGLPIITPAYDTSNLEDLGGNLHRNYNQNYEIFGVGDLIEGESMFDDALTLDDIFTPGGVEARRASEQPAAFQVAAMYGRYPLVALSKFAMGIGVVAGLPKAIYNLANGKKDALKPMFDNFLLDGITKFEEKVKEVMPIYATRQYQDGTLIDQMMTTKFWADDYMDGVAFASSAILPSGILGGAAKALKLSPTMQKFAQVWLGGAYNTLSESGIEAHDTKTSLQQELALKTYGVEFDDLFDEQKEAVNEVASEQAANVFGQNALVLMLSNVSLLSRAFKSPVNPIKMYALGKGKELGKTGIGKVWQKYGKVVGDAVKGIGTEGLWEEGLQYAFQENAKKIASGERAKPENFVESLGNIWGEWWHGFETTEGRKSMMLGALIGAGMGGASTFNNLETQQKVDDAAITRFELYAKQTAKDIEKSSEILEEMENISANEDMPEADRISKLNDLENELFAMQMTGLETDSKYAGALYTSAYDELIDQYTKISELDNQESFGNIYLEDMEKLKAQMQKANITKSQSKSEEEKAAITKQIEEYDKELKKISNTYNFTKNKTAAMMAGFTDSKEDNDYKDKAKAAIDFIHEFRQEFVDLHDKFNSEEDFKYGIPDQILRYKVRARLAEDNYNRYQSNINELIETESNKTGVDQNEVRFTANSIIKDQLELELGVEKDKNSKKELRNKIAKLNDILETENERYKANYAATHGGREQELTKESYSNPEFESELFTYLGRAQYHRKVATESNKIYLFSKSNTGRDKLVREEQLVERMEEIQAQTIKDEEEEKSNQLAQTNKDSLQKDFDDLTGNIEQQEKELEDTKNQKKEGERLDFLENENKGKKQKGERLDFLEDQTGKWDFLEKDIASKEERLESSKKTQDTIAEITALNNEIPKLKDLDTAEQEKQFKSLSKKAATIFNKNVKEVLPKDRPMLIKHLNEFKELISTYENEKNSEAALDETILENTELRVFEISGYTTEEGDNLEKDTVGERLSAREARMRLDPENVEDIKIHISESKEPTSYTPKRITRGNRQQFKKEGETRFIRIFDKAKNYLGNIYNPDVW